MAGPKIDPQEFRSNIGAQGSELVDVPFLLRCFARCRSQCRARRQAAQPSRSCQSVRRQAARLPSPLGVRGRDGRRCLAHFLRVWPELARRPPLHLRNRSGPVGTTNAVVAILRASRPRGLAGRHSACDAAAGVTTRICVGRLAPKRHEPFLPPSHPACLPSRYAHKLDKNRRCGRSGPDPAARAGICQSGPVANIGARQAEHRPSPACERRFSSGIPAARTSARHDPHDRHPASGGRSGRRRAAQSLQETRSEVRPEIGAQGPDLDKPMFGAPPQTKDRLSP